MSVKRMRLTGGGACWLFGNVLALLICIGIFVCLFSGCGKVTDGQSEKDAGHTQEVEPGRVNINKDSIFRLEKLEWELPVESVDGMIYRNDRIYLFGDDYVENGVRQAQVVLSADASAEKVTFEQTLMK